VNTEIFSSEGVDGGVSQRDDMDDEVDLSWSTVLKRTFEAFLREERPNMYGEELNYNE
jgi:WD repeat and SOF domain-containing protein 1